MHKVYDKWAFVTPDGEYFSAQMEMITVGISTVNFYLIIEDEAGVELEHLMDLEKYRPLALELKEAMAEIHRLREAGEWGDTSCHRSAAASPRNPGGT